MIWEGNIVTFIEIIYGTKLVEQASKFLGFFCQNKYFWKFTKIIGKPNYIHYHTLYVNSEETIVKINRLKYERQKYHRGYLVEGQ